MARPELCCFRNGFFAAVAATCPPTFSRTVKFAYRGQEAKTIPGFYVCHQKFQTILTSRAILHSTLACLSFTRILSVLIADGMALLWHANKALATCFCGPDNPRMNERKKVGRPPVAPDKELVHGTLRLTRAQWEKVRMAGVPALRLLIDRWRPKKP